MKNRQVSRRKGFTLIEVVTTLFIIGLLVALIYLNVAHIRKTAEDRQRAALMQTLQSQVNMFHIAQDVPDTQTITISNLMNAGYLTTSQVQQMGKAHFEIKGDKVIQGK